MSKKIFTLAAMALLASLMISDSAFARAAVDASGGKGGQSELASATPAYGIVAHRIGRMELSVNNNGSFGTGFAVGATSDWFTGDQVQSCEYPKNDNVEYLFAGAFWIGAVVGRDTLVSEGADGWSRTLGEFAPDEAPFGEIIYRSIRYPDEPELFEGAVSEEDYIMVYTDTFTDGAPQDFFSRPHIPLNIEVTERSYAWSYPYAQDFVLFDYEIRNIGPIKLENTYMGFYVDGDVGFTGDQAEVHRDDICGFRDSMLIKERGYDIMQEVNIAWIADNDGDPTGGTNYDNRSATAVTGTRIVRTPADELEVSFNWWVSHGTPGLDYGPRERGGVGKWKEPFRDLRTGGLGTPEGDVNKYYFLRNQEFDFDQIFTTSIQPTDTFWSPPPQELASDLADGYDTRYLLSFGPFDINPGEKLPVSFAYVAGNTFHRVPENIGNLPDNPTAFYANLYFDSLAANAAWASRVYDNPGVDTDDDGYRGEYAVFCDDPDDPATCDTVYYKGDGVPDFRGASPPPAPKLWLEPSVGKIKVRFNGLLSETARDVFSGDEDFEGYRVYVGRDQRESSFSLLSSYDIEDYNKYIYDDGEYVLEDIPFSLDSLRCLYGDSCNDPNFDPLAYSRTFPLTYRAPGSSVDSFFYFEPQDYNTSDLGSATPIVKRFPNQPYPTFLNPDSANADELTQDGYLKYFEYEVEIDNLLPTVQYWVNVTAFDFGSPQSGLKSLETPKSSGALSAYPISSSDAIESGDLEVYVYPNPYRFDGGYRTQGYEGRLDTDRPDDRVRRIHFVNLPHRCTIKIFTLDGDLVREIRHDRDASDPEASHDTWDLITRNTQLTVSGLYYWSVEADNGETQIGKLVVIM